MDEHTNTANLLEAAKTGNQKAESEILSKLFARFLPIVSLNLQKYSVLAETIDLEMKCHEVCQNAILEVKRLYPLNSEKFSVKRAVTVLHNVIDDFIINALYELARSSNSEAEKFLFALIRKKLMIYLRSKIWRY